MRGYVPSNVDRMKGAELGTEMRQWVEGRVDTHTHKDVPRNLGSSCCPSELGGTLSGIEGGMEDLNPILRLVGRLEGRMEVECSGL